MVLVALLENIFYLRELPCILFVSTILTISDMRMAASVHIFHASLAHFAFCPLISVSLAERVTA